MSVIEIAAMNDEQRAVWRLTREVALAFVGLPWALIGGLMVQVLEAERGVPSHFATSDVDAVLDVRAAAKATERAATILVDAGFEPEPYEDLVYRFVRGADTVDVLAPDHLGRRTDITTVPPASTLEALGSRQALNRCRVVRVDAGDGPFDLPVPNLIAAIVMKVRVATSAAGLSSQQKHERDLARLLVLEDDPVADRAILTPNERGYLRARIDMHDPDHPAWIGVSGALDGTAALRILGSANVA